MHWVLQENLFKETEWENLVGTLERFNIPYSVHKVIPFIGELMPPFHSKCPIDNYKNVICFGSYSMRQAAQANEWTPGVYDLEPFNFEIQMEHWGDLMLNADSKVVPFKDVEFDDIAFVRPIEDSKVFAGGIFDWKEFKTWQHNVCDLEEDYGNSLSKNTLVQVCNPKKIYSEYRFWIVNQQIVTASLYKRGGKVIYSSDVDSRFYGFVNMVLKTKNRETDITTSMVNTGWRPHDAFVIDVCETPDGIKIVEINTINAAGFYAANVQDIVIALEEMEKRKNG
jgi:hypothetical protein